MARFIAMNHFQVDPARGSEFEEHWRKHMAVAGRVLLGPRAASAIVDVTHHF